MPAGMSYDALHQLYDAISQRWTVRLLQSLPEDGTPAAGSCYLRHDIDVDPLQALELAQIESQRGIVATYHVLANGPIYHPSAPWVCSAISSIIDLGHEIGLHVDARALTHHLGSRDSLEATAGLASFVRGHAAVLEEVLGNRIRSVSFHRPTLGSLWKDAFVGGLANAYGSGFKHHYISDSSGRWRVGDPIAFLGASKPSYFQVLTHPMWWSEAGLAVEDSIRALFPRVAPKVGIDDPALFFSLVQEAIGVPIPAKA